MSRLTEVADIAPILLWNAARHCEMLWLGHDRTGLTEEEVARGAAPRLHYRSAEDVGQFELVARAPISSWEDDKLIMTGTLAEILGEAVKRGVRFG